MRQKRTSAESLILSRINPILDCYGIEDYSLVEGIKDRPDLLFNSSQGRLGIEITRLDYQEYCKWQNLAPSLPYNRSAEIEINLKKMLTSMMKKKRKKYREYVKLRSLSECWLILHNDVFEFPIESKKIGIPTVSWAEKNAQIELQELDCPFDKVLFNLFHPNNWYCFYDKTKTLIRSQVIYRWPSLILHESAVQLGRGENIVNLGANKSSRKRFD